MNANFDAELQEERGKLLGSLLLFTQVFYKFLTNRQFIVSEPIGRESHHITLARELTKVFRGETQFLLINIEPGSGKSEMCKAFIAWSLAHYPDSQYLYVSHGQELAEKHTFGVKQIITLPQYKTLFNVELASDSTAKANFRTKQGGNVYASGAKGSVIGQNAGLPGLDRFGGALIIDDIHKPDEVHSDTTRDTVNNNYFSTLIHRLRGSNTPIIFIGQRLREGDLADLLINGKDGRPWKTVIIPSIDEAGNVLNPMVHNKDFLRNLEEKSEYEYWSQYQQKPQPPGGGIFKKKWFLLLDEEPEILATFIVGDTAETDKNYNDATAFTFLGIYRIKHGSQYTNLYALHVLDCLEVRVEPKDLRQTFLGFYNECMKYKIKPTKIAIEKKSTGSYLLSTLDELQGLDLINIEHNVATGNKTTRFLKAQPYFASKQVTFPLDGKHTEHCIEHLCKITANETHEHDDIADTFADAIKLALIDGTIYPIHNTESHAKTVSKMVLANQKTQHLRAKQWQPRK